MDRRTAGESRRDLDHRLGDQDRHGVQVARVCFKSKSLCLQWDGSAAAERVENGGRAALARPDDFGFSRTEYRRVRGVLPLDEFFDDAEEPLAFTLLGFLSREP